MGFVPNRAMRGPSPPTEPYADAIHSAGGWVPLYRESLYRFLDDMPARVLRTCFLVWMVVLSRARQGVGNAYGIRLARGQMLGGGRSLGEFCRLSHREVRTALSHLKKRGYVTQVGCVITIINFDRYVPLFPQSGTPPDTLSDTTDGTPRDTVPGTPPDTRGGDKQEGKEKSKGEPEVSRTNRKLPMLRAGEDRAARRRRATTAWQWGFKLLGPAVSLEAMDLEEDALWSQAFSMGFSDSPVNRKRLRWAMCYVCGPFWIGEVLKSASGARSPGAWIQRSLETACLEMFEDPERRKYAYPVDDPRYGVQSNQTPTPPQEATT